MRPRVARGAAYGDINNDGALDIARFHQNGPAVLFRNTGATNHSLRIKLVGTKSNRDGIGAVVSLSPAATCNRRCCAAAPATFPPAN